MGERIRWNVISRLWTVRDWLDEEMAPAFTRILSAIPKWDDAFILHTLIEGKINFLADHFYNKYKNRCYHYEGLQTDAQKRAFLQACKAPNVN